VDDVAKAQQTLSALGRKASAAHAAATEALAAALDTYLEELNAWHALLIANRSSDKEITEINSRIIFLMARHRSADSVVKEFLAAGPRKRWLGF
jgi:hypothetical protein